MMIQLYYSPGKANMAPHIILEELAVPYELVLVDTDKNAHRSSDYVKLNPSGRIPVLIDGDLVLFETAAICLYLADAYPQRGLAPALGTKARAHLYKWLMYLTNTLQTEIITYFYSDRVTEDDTASAQVKRRAEQRISEMLNILEQALQDNAERNVGPYLLGEQFSILDPYLFMLCRWTRGMHKPARSLPLLGKYLRNMLTRESVQDCLNKEGLKEPFI
jgi:glutathione S-transferase